MLVGFRSEVSTGTLWLIVGVIHFFILNFRASRIQIGFCGRGRDELSIALNVLDQMEGQKNEHTMQCNNQPSIKGRSCEGA